MFVTDTLYYNYSAYYYKIMLLTLILFLKFGPGSVTGVSLEENGPTFIESWDSTLITYSNRVGTKVPCRAVGTPKPSLEWLTKEFYPVSNITTIREVDQDGNLQIYPFDPPDFRADIHSGVYRCRASNSVGSVISPEVNVRAVLDSSYEIENLDISVLKGNVGILRCRVPQQVRDFVRVTSWVQDSTLTISPNSQTGKYVLLPNGDLFVFSVDSSDSYKNFACVTTHKTTNEIKISTQSRIYVKDSETSDPVKLLLPKQRTINVNVGEEFYVPCLGSGNPPPNYHWFVEKDGKVSETELPPSPNEHQSSFSTIPRHSVSHVGPIFSSQARSEDAGKVLVCWVNNSISHEVARVQLNVYVPLTVQISPKNQVVDVGRSATFRCLIMGIPLDSIDWYKNGRKITGGSSSRFTISSNRFELTITSVHPEDAGMYQCFGSNDQNSVQDSAQLRLGSILPELTYRFTQQTIQPGPSVSLKCSGVGNPPPQFTWALDGFPLPQSERYLVGQYVTIHDKVITHVNITNAESGDGGLYSCTATNSMGSISHSARLNIYGPPFIRPIPTVKAVSGKLLVIQCPVSGYPIDSISWGKGGSTLPVNRRQRVYPNGTLMIEQVQEDDDGIYVCEAKNRQGSTSNRDLNVQVIVAPKIMPFQFMSDLLKEGQRASVSCSVMEGDRPLEFSWLFDEKPISTSNSEGPRITFPDEYSSILVIDTLSSAHSGLYTCIVQNSAGHEQHSALLTVNVPPKWVLEPRDINVSLGQSIALDCQAQGYPTPSILWKRATGLKPGEYKDFPTTWPGLLPNGTIHFDEIRKEDEGQYLCEARNKVGAGLSKVLYLKVNAPAQFRDRDQQISVRVGEKAILQCRAKGDLPIDIQWSNKHSRVSSDSGKYLLRHQELEDGVLSELLISEVNREDSGVYSCRGSNMFGIDQTLVILNVQEPPGPPVHLRVTDQKSHSIRISWVETNNGNSPLISFIIQYKSPSDSWNDSEEVIVPSLQSTAKLDNLLPATTYQIRLFASNSMGSSVPSEIIQVSTLEEIPGGPPLSIIVESLTSTKLKVGWTAPERKLWHGIILGYYLGYTELGLALTTDERNVVVSTPSYTHRFGYSSNPVMDSVSGFHFKTVEIQDDFSGVAILENLGKFTRYGIVVQAYNSKGPGPMSVPVIGTTLPDVPSISPQNIACHPTSSQSLQIKWEDPPIEAQHGNIIGYKLKHNLEDYEIPDLPKFTPETKTISTTTAMLHGLRKWTNYSVSVLAFTVVGDGAFSQPIICRTDEDVPGPPAAIKAIVSSKRSITVSWLAPVSPNGLIDKYRVYYKTVDGSKIEKKLTQSSSETILNIVGLRENHEYEFWVTGSTRIGEGGSSSKIKMMTTSKVSAKIASFSQSLWVAWKKELSLPCEWVGIPEPKVHWKFNGNYIEYTSQRHISSSGSLVLDNLNPESNGNYSCIVSNSHGNDSITYELNVQVPPPPPILRVVQIGFDKVSLGWKSEGNGGSPIKGYIMHYKRENGDWEELNFPDPYLDNYILKSLTCGSKYQVYMTGFNRIGTGSPSKTLHFTTKGKVPTPPPKNEVLTGNSSSITIKIEGSWTRTVEEEEPGCPILRYSVEYKEASNSLLTSSDTNWIQVPNEFTKNSNLKPRTHFIHGLKPNTKYLIRLKSENGAGTTVSTYDFITSRSNEHFVGLGTSDSSSSKDGSNSNEYSSSSFNTTFLIIFPTILATLAVSSVIGVMCYFKQKSVINEPKVVVGVSPGGSSSNAYAPDNQVPNGLVRELRYCPPLTSMKGTELSTFGLGNSEDCSVPPQSCYKTIDPADYGEDVCPYATFELPDKIPRRPMLNKGLLAELPSSSTLNRNKKQIQQGYHTGDTLYNTGNVYSGPYHAVEAQPPGSGFLYNQAPTMQIRDYDYGKRKRHSHQSNRKRGGSSQQQEDSSSSSLLAQLRNYDAYGSDSEGEKYTQRNTLSSPSHHHQVQDILSSRNKSRGGLGGLQEQHEMSLFNQKRRQEVDSMIASDSCGETESSESDEASPSYHLSRKKHNKSKSSMQSQSGESSSCNNKLRVLKSSSGYSSHTEQETPLSFCEKIRPPSGFSDPRDNVSAEHDDEDSEDPNYMSSPGMYKATTGISGTRAYSTNYNSPTSAGSARVTRSNRRTNPNQPLGYHINV